jgi:hypothetical protein
MHKINAHGSAAGPKFSLAALPPQEIFRPIFP